MRSIIIVNIVGLTLIGFIAMTFSQSGAQQAIAQESVKLLLQRHDELEQRFAELSGHVKHQQVQIQQEVSKLSKTLSDNAVDAVGCPPVLFIRPFRKRADVGAELKRLGLKGIGVEVGVQLGFFSEQILAGWQQAYTFVAVDLWAPQENYKDQANQDQEKQNDIMKHAVTLINSAKERGWVKHTRICRNFSTVCVHQFENDSLDFVYVDARHDRKGVLEDLVAYWPKVKRGGVIAGHDYLEMSDLPGFQDDWSLNGDGTRDLTGRVVKGAVDDFFSGEAPVSPSELRRCPRQVTVGYAEGSYFTWAVGK